MAQGLRFARDQLRALRVLLLTFHIHAFFTFLTINAIFLPQIDHYALTQVSFCIPWDCNWAIRYIRNVIVALSRDFDILD